MLGYFFTATDTLTLIDANRIQSFEDARRIVTQPLMSGTDFVDVASFYRPVTSLSYGFDYSIWGLDPLGYHLTDLVLHAAVCLLVFGLAWILSGGRWAVAWLSSFIFAAHPILVEIVPATARRHDVIATLFVLLSLILFLKSRSERTHKVMLTICSVFCYGLALGAKEIAIVLPFLILAYLLIYQDRSRPAFRLRDSLLGASAYFATSLAYAGWWLTVVKGDGGYSYRDPDVLETIVILKSYLLDLVYPAGPVTFAQLARACSWAVLYITCACLIIRGGSSRALKPEGIGRWVAIARVLLVTSGLASAICISAFPLVAPQVNRSIEQAYNGEGSRLLAGLMDGKGSLPVEFYFDQFETVSVSLLAFALVVSIVLLLALEYRGETALAVAHACALKNGLFLSAWLALPLGIFLATQAFDHRSMYLPVVPFSLLLSITLIESAGAVRRRYPLRPVSRRLLVAAGLLATASGLLINLVAFSPLLRDYREWRDSGEISRLFLGELSEILEEIPDGARIRVRDLPDGIAYHDGIAPRVKSATYLASYSIESWLELVRPGCRIEVEARDRKILSGRPEAIGLETRREDGYVAIIVTFDE